MLWNTFEEPCEDKHLAVPSRSISKVCPKDLSSTGMPATRTMARFLLPIAILFTLIAGASLVPTVSAAATPQFFETVVVEDTDGDFEGRGWVDIVAVYVGEKFGFDPEKRILKGNHALFRFELAAIQPLTCSVVYRYDVEFMVDGAAKNATATMSTSAPSTGQDSCSLKPGAGTQIIGNSLVTAVPSDSLGIMPGSVISEVWAHSSIVGPAGLITQDVAPFDNANAASPSATKPGGTLLSYTAVGVYPFLRVVPLTPTEQYSVNGGEVEYAFQFFSHEAISNDNIRVRFEIPDGWTLSPSRGTTGADPEGQLSGGSAGSPVEFTFTTSATGIVNEGDVANIVMHVIADSGGYERINTITTVSGAKITDANLTFDLASKGPFKAEDASTIRFSASHPTIDLAGQALSIDVYQGTRRITTLTAKDVGAGVYEVQYSFPDAGEYRLDVYISSMKPSPHQEFTVSVEKGGLAPGPGFLTILLVGLLGAAGYLRRNR